MKGKLVTVLFIIVFILLVAVIISLLTDDQGVTNIDDYRLEATETESNILADLPSAQPAAETVPPTMLPLPTQVPTPTPLPTPTPTPPPTPVPIVTDLGSGSFVSHSGNKINIIADYKVTALNETQVRIDVDVDVESYSLENRASRSLHVSLGGEFVSIDVPEINYGGGTLMRNDLGSASFTVDLPLGSSNNYTLAVEWQFGGVYFNAPVPVIECGGNISIVR